MRDVCMPASQNNALQAKIKHKLILVLEITYTINYLIIKTLDKYQMNFIRTHISLKKNISDKLCDIFMYSLIILVNL